MVNDAYWSTLWAHLFEYLSRHQLTGWAALRCLEHNGVASCERRKNREKAQSQRGVPRRDAQADWGSQSAEKSGRRVIIH